MKRRVFNVLAAVSLVLSVATIAVWVRRFHKGQSIERVDPARRIVVTSMRGLVTASRWDGVFEPTVGSDFELNYAPRGAWQKWMYWHGWDGEDTDPAASAYDAACGRNHLVAETGL